MAEDRDSDQDWRHRRTTSMITKLISPTQTQPSKDSSKDTPITPCTNTANPGDPTIADKHGPTHSVPLDAVQPPRVPSPVRRRHFVGKDWESWRLKDTGPLNDDIKYPFQEKALRRTGHRAYETPQQQTAPALSFSGVQQVISLSPISPGDSPGQATPDQASPISLGPQSSKDSQSIRAYLPQPPLPDPNDLPKYMSAFEYAMTAYLEDYADRRFHLHLPSPTLQDAVSEVTSPLLPRFREDEVSYAGSEENNTQEDVPEYGIPFELIMQKGIWTSIQLMHLRTLLMQCTVLQSTIRDLERRPWEKDAAHNRYWYYSKMHQHALKAQQIAEALRSSDLRARCEYWAGRACGGTKDYQAAVWHFERAILHDVQNDTHPSGRPRLRGLRPRENEDVQFLLQSASDRSNVWDHKTAAAKKRAQNESDRTGISFEACFEEEWKGQFSPPWLPDRDRIVNIARQKYVIQKTMDKRARVLATMQRKELTQLVDEKVQHQWEEAGIIEGEMARRTLNDEEWRYIWHGDEEANKRRIVQESQHRPTPGIPHVESPSDMMDLSPVSATGTQYNLHEVSPHAERSLAQALEDLEMGFDGELATPTPTIQHRRNISLDNILTAKLQQRSADLGEAIRGTSEDSDVFGVSSPEGEEGEMDGIPLDDDPLSPSRC